MDFEREIYDIKFTEDCKEEIFEIYEYISKKLVARNSAKQLMGKMRDSIMNLSKFPNIYAKIEKKDIQIISSYLLTSPNLKCYTKVVEKYI